MKKTFLYLLSALLILSCLSCALSACSGKKDTEKENDSLLESGAVTDPDHFSPEDTVVFQDTEKTEPQTSIITEAPTEKETEKITEIPVEKETEKETEPQVSLKYFSYGNGTCAVSGIGNYTDVYVIIPEKSPSGDIVTSIDDKAFFDNTEIKAIQIPSTVMSIGNMAFGGCSSLMYVSVSENNKMFTDVNGILYSKDKTKLILFPSANQASELFLSVNICEIADMAFYSAPFLKSIKYGGTLNDWSKIKIGDKNYGLYSASMTFAVTQ